MTNYKEQYLALYDQKKKSAKEALDLIQSRDWIFTAQAAAEPLKAFLRKCYNNHNKNFVI